MANMANMAKIGKYISQNLNIFAIGNFHYFMMVNSSGKNFKIANGKMPLEMPVEFCHDDNMDENPNPIEPLGNNASLLKIQM